MQEIVGCQANFVFFFFSIWVFFYEHSRITGLQGKGEGISLTPHNRLHLLHRHLAISRAITAESSPLHITSSLIRTGSLLIPSANRPTTKLRTLVICHFRSVMDP